MGELESAVNGFNRLIDIVQILTCASGSVL